MRTTFDFDFSPLDNFGDPDDYRTVKVKVLADPAGGHVVVKVTDRGRDITRTIEKEYPEQYNEILDQARHFIEWARDNKEEA